MNSIEDLLSQMKGRKDEIDEIKKYIDIKTAEFEKSMSAYRDSLLNQKQRLWKLEETPINVGLSEVVDCLAKQWGVSASDIDCQYSSLWDHSCYASITNSYNAKENKRLFNFNKATGSSNIPFTFKLARKNNNDANNRVMLDCVMCLDVVQRDGKRFGDHVTAVSKIKDDELIVSKLVIDDLSQLVLNFSLKELIRENQGNIVPRNDLCKAILDGADRYMRDQQEMCL